MLYNVPQRLICIMIVFFISLSSISFTLTNPMDKIPSKKILALGDSYTIGESVLESERWSAQLIEFIKKDISISKHDIVAQTGWTTFELQDAIASRKLDKLYDLVTLLIGVNNQYRGLSKEEFRKDFQQLLQTAANFTSGNFQHVMVLSIPDWGVSPFASNRDKAQIAKEIDAFNSVVKEECQKLHVPFVDITPISRAYPNDATMIAEDGLHFSGKMYALWAKAAQEEALKILTK